MYKLVALDMDGTLLNSQKAISPRTKQAIQAARDNGVQVVLASGRPLEGMTKYLDELGMTGENDYVLSYNASLVQRVESKTVIRKQIMTGRDAKNIASLASDFGTFIHAFTLSVALSLQKTTRTPSMNQSLMVYLPRFWTLPSWLMMRK